MDDPTPFAPPLGQRAAHEQLAYIRRTLDAAGRLSIVPGWGLVGIGLLALGTAWANQHYLGGAPWSAEFLRELESGPAGAGGIAYFLGLALWGALLVVSLGIGYVTMRAKARRTGQVFWSPVLRKALWGYAAALGFGALLTFSMLGRPELLPEVWLGCYGVALVGAGAVSISPIRWMGLCFLALAAVAAFTRASGTALLAAGFGGLHILFGAYIAWRHDG